MRPLALLTLFAAALTARAQCYTFSGPGAALKINISAVILQAGPILVNGGSDTGLTFSSDNSFTVGTTVLASQSVANGVASIQYVPSAAPGVPDNTAFSLAVPNADSNPTGSGEHSWTVYLAGIGDLIPTRLLPTTLPPFTSWAGVSNTNYIRVASGALQTNYPITSITGCAATPGGGNPSGPVSGASVGPNLGNPADLPGACACGNPINIGTGNVYAEFSDYQAAGSNPFGFTRYYNSLATGLGTFANTLGPNWRSTYDRYIRIVSTNSVIAERPDGQQLSFTLNGANWTTQPDADYQLTHAGTTWTLTDHHDTIETYSTVPGAEGLLQTIQYRNGYALTLQYTNANQLVSVSDPFNRTLFFTYQNNLLHTLTTPGGLVMTYNVTPSGSLAFVSASTTPPALQTYLYENSALPNALTGLVDPNNNRYSTWTYDSSGRALTAQHANSAGLVSIAYNDTDGSRTVTHALGQQELYKFTVVKGVPKITGIDRLATSTTAAAQRAFTYDANGYTASRTDWSGTLTTLTSDAHGQPTSVTEASGTPQARTTTYAYHSAYRLPLRIVAPGVTTVFTYDGIGQLLTKSLTDSTTNTSPYSTAGQIRTWVYGWSNYELISIRSPRIDIPELTRWIYDSNGSLTAVNNALGQSTQITKHTPDGQPVTVIDPNGVSTNYTYDLLQHLTSAAVTTSAGVFTTQYTFDAANNPLTTTLPDGSSLTKSYDAAHRVNALADPLGNSMTFALDAFGDRNQILTLDPHGSQQRKQSAIFDALGRLQQSIGGANQTTTYAYDSNGSPTTITDPLNHATQQIFDPLNRQIQQIDPLKATSITTYDQRDRRTTIIDPDGATTTYTYDGFGDLIQQQSPITGTTAYRYDPAGNLIQTIDARGVETDFAYDALDRIISVTYPGNPAENVVNHYDELGHGFAIGHLTSVTDAAGTLSRSYEERGNLLSESRTRGKLTLTTSYTYDAASRVASLTYPSNWGVIYARDAVGRIVSVSAQPPAPGANTPGAPQPLITAIAYAPFGPVTGLTYGNGLVETRTFDRAYRLTRIGSNVQTLAYSYDAADNVVALSGQSFSYDALNRLATDYTYDPNSNRLTDASPSSAQDGLGTVTALTYNQSNRLATVAAGPRQLAAYTYDAFGHRLAKLGAQTATTFYQYDSANHLLEETDGQGSARVDYIYLDDRPVATIQPNAGPSTAKIYYLHDDRLGAPQLATDSTQSVAWFTTYQPFGAISSPPTIVTQNLRLPGQEADIDTGLYYNAARDYAPTLGRYFEPNPAGLPASLNLYGYANANPLSQTDPTGLCAISANDLTTAAPNFCLRPRE